MMLWCTSRSIAAAVVMGSLKIFSHFENGRLTREDDAASLVALGQQGEQNLHLLAILLHVTDVVEDQWTEFRETFQQTGET